VQVSTKNPASKTNSDGIGRLFFLCWRIFNFGDEIHEFFHKERLQPIEDFIGCRRTLI
jgi:hypothetical protein